MSMGKLEPKSIIYHTFTQALHYKLNEDLLVLVLKVVYVSGE